MLSRTIGQIGHVIAFAQGAGSNCSRPLWRVRVHVLAEVAWRIDGARKLSWIR
jgi:hypothetical protein